MNPIAPDPWSVGGGGKRAVGGTGGGAAAEFQAGASPELLLTCMDMCDLLVMLRTSGGAQVDSNDGVRRKRLWADGARRLR